MRVPAERGATGSWLATALELMTRARRSASPAAIELGIVDRRVEGDLRTRRDRLGRELPYRISDAARSELPVRPRARYS